jgi:phosphinothricin acetyltransferase
MNIRAAAAADLPQINAIYNHYVTNTVALFDLVERTAEEAQAWLDAHQAPRYPAIVAVDGTSVVGWASLSQLSPRGGYDFACEVSLYVAPERHRQGIGVALLKEVLAQSDTIGHHAVIARIAGGNDASVGVFSALGFEHVGL